MQASVLNSRFLAPARNDIARACGRFFLFLAEALEFAPRIAWREGGPPGFSHKCSF
jgi:hypothetical protein